MSDPNHDSYIKWLRHHMGPQKLLLVFASACIRDQNGRILWQKRGDFGWWGLPGGILELRENLPDCVVREVKEETGLDVTPTRLLGVYSSPDFDIDYPNGDQAQQITACFECQVTGGTLQADGEETLDLAWFTPDEVPQTAVWYQAMATDALANHPYATFHHGAKGSQRSTLPYYKLMRPRVGKAPYIMPTGLGIVLNDDGHVLLQRRSDTGQWGIPGGGVELGERIDQTAVNELREETGLEVEIIRMTGFYSDLSLWLEYPHGDEVQVVSAVFLCRAVGGTLQADLDESLEVRFFAPDALPPLPNRHVRRLHDALANLPTTQFS